MNRDEIIEMARQAGFQTGAYDYADGNGGLPFIAPIASGNCLPEIERFAALVSEKEREACAALCDQATEGNLRTLASCNDGKEFGAALVSAGAKEQSERLAAAIRARNT